MGDMIESPEQQIKEAFLAKYGPMSCHVSTSSFQHDLEKFEAGAKWAMEEARLNQECIWCKFSIRNCECRANDEAIKEADARDEALHLKEDDSLAKLQDDTTVSRVYKLERREKIANETGGCSYCPPHAHENKTYKKHGQNKPRYKNKR